MHNKVTSHPLVMRVLLPCLIYRITCIPSPRRTCIQTSTICPKIAMSSTAEVVTIPRREKGIDIARAVSEAQAAVVGALAGSRWKDGNGARIKDSLWATDPTLLAYSDLMLTVPDELASVATVLYGMVRMPENEGGGDLIVTMTQ